MQNVPKMEQPHHTQVKLRKMSTAMDVLTDVAIVRHIVGFQRGLPRDLIELARRHWHAFTPYNSGLLPRLAIDSNDCVLLRRVYHYVVHHNMNDVTYLRLGNLWGYALERSCVSILEFMESTPEMQGGNETPSNAVAKLVTNTQRGVLLWVLHRHPEYLQALTLIHMRRFVQHGDLEEFKVLKATYPTLYVEPALIDHVAGLGQLDWVQYLHDQPTTVATTKAMDEAASNGHLQVVRFLHTHRREGCTYRAVLQAACRGHAEILAYLKDHYEANHFQPAVDVAAREGYVKGLQALLELVPHMCSGDLIVLAAENGHLEVVEFLHTHFHQHCTHHAMDVAAGSGMLCMVKYLSDNCSETDGSALLEAARGGYRHILAYLVRERTDGCLVKARRLTIDTYCEDFLSGFIDPSIKQETHNTDQCQARPNRSCQKK